MYLGLLVGANQAAIQEEPGRFVATLPNGVTVELVGVSYHNPGGGFEPKRWWQPDGTEIPDGPYRHPRESTGAGSGYYAREFAMRITGADGYSCATYDSLGRSRIQPVVPLNEKNESVPGVLAFVCRFKDTRATDTLRIGVSTRPWQKVEEWVDDAWQEHDHDNIVFQKSENPLILTWPRRKGRAVILEMVRTDVDDVQARRMLLFDRDDQVHEENPRMHGEGPGLIKEQYWFWNMRLEDIHRLEYQRRPYQWVEFRNVSLEPGHETDVEIAVLAVKDKLARGLSVSEQEKDSLGYLVQKLAQKLRFPARGRATYRIEERHAGSQEPRLLRCNYIFDDILYRFSVVGAKPGDLDVRWYFDGEKTILWEIRSEIATIWEGRREMTPIYNLQQYFPSEIIEDLLSHKVEFKGAGEISGIPCSLLESVMSSKDRLKVWVTKEPDVYPLRIERYEHDNLRYLYEAANVKSWRGVLFPHRTTISWYRSDDALQHSLISSSVVSVESFAPDVEIEAGEFTPDFPPGTVVNRTPTELDVSDFEPTPPAKRLREFADIDIEFNVEQAKGKMILVCFWDMNQRPSRSCVVQLARRARELEERGVVVVVVHASRVNKSKLSEWLKKNDVPFPAGTIAGDEERLRFTWGVKSLPWPVLTDREHIVVAEGFNVNELDDKIIEFGEE
jgi:hypothetical protein